LNALTFSASEVVVSVFGSKVLNVEYPLVFKFYFDEGTNEDDVRIYA